MKNKIGCAIMDILVTMRWKPVKGHLYLISCISMFKTDIVIVHVHSKKAFPMGTVAYRKESGRFYTHFMKLHELRQC